jgi:hypothetical protein
MDLPRELLQLAEIYGGEKGYVPVKDNATDLILNGTWIPGS